jgi:tellurite resistance protein TehA-like permease
MQEKHIIKYLAPSWFAVIMGTGGLANILFLWQEKFPAGEFLGIFLAGLANTLYFLVLVPWVIPGFSTTIMSEGTFTIRSR